MIAQRQMLEIVRRSLHSRLVIMDEPTSGLTLNETDPLNVIADLKAMA